MALVLQHYDARIDYGFWKALTMPDVYELRLEADKTSINRLWDAQKADRPSTMDMILHIARRDDWEKAQSSAAFRGDTLESEGFIHCSRPEQVVRVANSLYRGRDDLVLLCIDSSKVEAEIRYENLEGGDELFPHIYGPLNVAAVVAVLDFEPQADGTFTLPERLVVEG
jgi:uncharacterized protein (DUF952 family)